MLRISRQIRSMLEVSPGHLGRCRLVDLPWRPAVLTLRCNYSSYVIGFLPVGDGPVSPPVAPASSPGQILLEVLRVSM
jgi:hypothetical protein